MPLPLFDHETGYLPPGEHRAVWAEVVERFGWNPIRRSLLDGLFDALCMLGAAGCRMVWLNGSFVTAKDEPGDFDAVWDYTDVDEATLDPTFFELADGRRAQKARFGGELFPNWVNRSSESLFSEFFQHDRYGRQKGIVVPGPREVER